MKLSREQAAALQDILGRFNRGEQYITLKGSAGTGKTFLTGELVRRLRDEGRDFYVCAPTHQSARVLNDKISGEQSCEQIVKTIHSFLGLVLYQDNRGGYDLRESPNRYVPGNCIVIMDEASMCGAKLWKYIQRTCRIQWLFVGDPAQLPPVNEPDSCVFEFPGPELKTIVRQAEGNPIIALAWKVRQGEKYIRYADTTMDRDFFTERAVEEFKSIGHRVRILAYHNFAVSRYNKMVRAAILGHEAPRFVEGEWLVARNSWSLQREIRLYTSEEVRVDRIEKGWLSTFERDWVVWRLTVSSDLTDLGSRDVFVLHEDEHESYDIMLTALRDDALADPTLWWKFYRLKEAFAQLDYSYAMTVHKSQGSTFESVFIDHEDLMCCSGPERQALVYVAVTRPSDRLYLYI